MDLADVPPPVGSVAVSEADGFLAGLRVLEAGDGPAGSSAAALLGALGAEVTKLVTPAAVPAGSGPTWPSAPACRRCSSTTPRSASPTPMRGRPCCADPSPFDVVVCDRIAGATGADPVRSSTTTSRWSGAATRACWVTISAYGLRGPDRARIGIGAHRGGARPGCCRRCTDPRTGHR